MESWSTPERKLKVAQIGVARFGAHRRARMRETELFELLAVHDWNLEAQAQAAREEGAREASSYEELLSTPGLEAVIISTGAKFHAEQALAAMQRGLHVFVEKPLCSTIEETRELLAAQKKYGVVAATGHVDHAFDPIAQATSQLIQDGELGAIAAVEATTAHSGGHHIKPGDWRGDAEKNPGGMLFHCGVHLIYEMMFYCGAVEKVWCIARTDLHTTSTPDTAHCHLVFSSGVSGVLNAYHVTPYYSSFNIFGTEGNLYRESQPKQIALWKQARHPARMEETRESVSLPPREEHTGNLRSFYRAIMREEGAHPFWTQAADALSVVFAAQESARSGSVVAVHSPFFAESSNGKHAAMDLPPKNKCLKNLENGYNLVTK